MLGSALLFSSCKKDKDNKADTTYNGPEVQVGNGMAQTFATFRHTGEPKEVGVILTKEAFTGLPSTNHLSTGISYQSKGGHALSIMWHWA
jgi:hypothetical protein